MKRICLTTSVLVTVSLSIYFEAFLAGTENSEQARLTQSEVKPLWKEEQIQTLLSKAIAKLNKEQLPVNPSVDHLQEFSPEYSSPDRGSR